MRKESMFIQEFISYKDFLEPVVKEQFLFEQ